MKHTFRITVWIGAVAFIAAHVSVALSATNVPPTPVVIQAVQRPGTTFMDIDYRVDDPDDTTVQTAALAFVNGGNDLTSVLKLNTLVEGTAANIGTNVPANTLKRLTWNVAADWNTNFGNVQVEILAKDGRGLLPFHWITLPSNGPNPAITINAQPIYDVDLLPIWYWLIATSDPAMQLVNGQLFGLGGNYPSSLLVQGTSTTATGRDFLWQRLNVRSLLGGEMSRAKAGRYGFQSVDCYSVAKGFVSSDRIYGWGNNTSGQVNFVPLNGITAVAVGINHTLLLAGGEVTGFGSNAAGQINTPDDATNVVAIAAGSSYSLALRADGKAVGWGRNDYGQTTIPDSATNVVAVAAGMQYSLALRADRTVVGWGNNNYGQTAIPGNATNVVAIAGGANYCLALKADGMIVGWGDDSCGQLDLPASGSNNAVAIAAGRCHSLALKADGTVVGWGDNSYGQTTIPDSATNVVAIAAGNNHSLALKADGTVIVWGDNSYGQLNAPAGLSGIDLIGVGCRANHIVVVDKRTP
jgi:hypothetical protein